MLSDLVLEDVDRDATDFLEEVPLGRGGALVGLFFDCCETELLLLLLMLLLLLLLLLMLLLLMSAVLFEKSLLC